jgi:hypothetical protein
MACGLDSAAEPPRLSVASPEENDFKELSCSSIVVGVINGNELFFVRWL